MESDRFRRSRNDPVVKGGNIVLINEKQVERVDRIHHCHEFADDPYKHLLAHVSPAAYAAQQECDAPKCHPNTRTVVLNQIMDWVMRVTFPLQWIMWVYGPAGAGKSSIARSVVDMCLQKDVTVASFFFFRADSTRNILGPLVSTLAYQLMKCLRDLEPIIFACIQANPLIFMESLEAQFQALIIDPLSQLHHDSPITRTILLLFDGVDECGGDNAHATFIRTVVQLVQTLEKIPVIALFFTRPEPEIKSEFWAHPAASITHTLVLDSKYLPDVDIRRFLDDNFLRIKETHPYRALLPSQWPKTEHVDEIVRRSSGQFIYASSAIKFISNPRLHPDTQLAIICGLKPAGKQTPFAQLDALYIHIFSQVQDIERAILILATIIVANRDTVKECQVFLETLSHDDICIALADLVSLITVSDDGDIQIAHASLQDFLTDKTRSQEYYIDVPEWSTRLFNMFLQKKNCSSVWFDKGDFKNIAITEELRQALLDFDPPWLVEFIKENDWTNDVTNVKEIEFGDGGKIYQHHLYLTMRAVRHQNLWSDDPSSLAGFRGNHDVTHAISRLDHEEGAKASSSSQVNDQHQRTPDARSSANPRSPFRSRIPRPIKSQKRI